MITRRRLLELVLPGAALTLVPERILGQVASARDVRLNVWRHVKNSGCCGPWVQELADAGFNVQMEQTGNPEELRGELGVPKDLWCCHTAVMEGYIIEGHVPVEDILRLLRERPVVSGLAAPHFLDQDGKVRTSGSYEVVAFWRDGMRSIFATHYLNG